MIYIEVENTELIFNDDGTPKGKCDFPIERLIAFGRSKETMEILYDAVRFNKGAVADMQGKYLVYEGVGGVYSIASPIKAIIKADNMIEIWKFRLLRALEGFVKEQEVDEWELPSSYYDHNPYCIENPSGSGQICYDEDEYFEAQKEKAIELICSDGLHEYFRLSAEWENAFYEEYPASERLTSYCVALIEAM